MNPILMYQDDNDDETINQTGTDTPPEAGSSLERSGTEEGVSASLRDESPFHTFQLAKEDVRAITLPNGLRVALVSRPDADAAAACLFVRAGSQHEPHDTPGIAHLLEHLLFLGTEQHPGKHDFKRFLTSCGGKSNAATGEESTWYYFSVAPREFPEALSRFSEFFRSPLLSTDSVASEVKAVDSEFWKKYRSEKRRLRHVVKSLCSVSHPFHHFGAGNMNTLLPKGDSPEEIQALTVKLRAFFEEHYKSHVMTLALVGRESLEELERLAAQHFGSLNSSDRRKEQYITHRPFEYEHLGYAIEVVPAGEIQRLTILFPYPNLEAFKDSKPEKYLGYTVGYEGTGSLRKLLADKGWAEELRAGLTSRLFDFSIFAIEIDLSDAGTRHVDEIVELTFQYLAVLSESGVSEELDNQLRKVRELQHRYKDLLAPPTLAVRAAKYLWDHPLDGCAPNTSPSFTAAGSHAPASGNPKTKFSADDIHDLLDRYLVPRNALLFLISRHFQSFAPPLEELSDSSPTSTGISDAVLNLSRPSWEKEPWYGTVHRKRKIDRKHLSNWLHPPSIHPFLGPPPLNRFVPTDLSLRCDRETSAAPQHSTVRTSQPQARSPHHYSVSVLGRNGPREAELIHLLDEAFRVPKGNITVQFGISRTQGRPGADLLMELFFHLLLEDVNTLLYDANTAGLSGSFGLNGCGNVVLSVGGFSDTLPLLLHEMLERTRSLLDDLKKVSSGWQPRENPKEDAHGGRSMTTTQPLPSTVASSEASTPCNGPRGTSRDEAWDRIGVRDMEWRRQQKLQERFDALRLRDLRQYENFAFSDALRRASRGIAEVVNGSVISVASCIEFLSNPQQCTIGALVRAVEAALSRSELTVFVHGNYDFSEAENILKTTAEHLPTDPLLREETCAPRAVMLPSAAEGATPQGALVEIINNDENDANGAVEIHFQICREAESEEQMKRDVALSLLGTIAHRSAFSHLRTSRQLGYSVGAYVRGFHGMKGLSIRVESVVEDPDNLEKSIEAWLVQFREELAAMTPEQFGCHAEGIASRTSSRDDHLTSQHRRLWQEIALKRYDYNRSEREAEILRDPAIDWKSEILSLFDDNIAYHAPRRRKLTAQVWSKQQRLGQPYPDKNSVSPSQPNRRILRTPDDIVRFRRSRPLCPVREEKVIRKSLSLPIPAEPSPNEGVVEEGAPFTTAFMFHLDPLSATEASPQDEGRAAPSRQDTDTRRDASAS